MHWPGSHLHRTLSGILPCEARTFLTWPLSVLPAAITYLTLSKTEHQTVNNHITNFLCCPSPQITDPAKQPLIHQSTLPPTNSRQNRILGNILNRHSDKIIQKLQLAALPPGIPALPPTIWNKSGSAYSFSTESSYTSAELNITSAFS